MRRRPSLSTALWLPTIFTMVIASRPLSEWVAGGGPAGGTGGSNPIDEAFYVFVAGGSLFIASKRGVRWGKFIAANIPLMAIYTYFLSSTIWSDDPIGSAKRIVKDFGLLFIIALVFSEKEPAQAIRAVFVRSAYFLLPMSLVFDRWFPRFAREFNPLGNMEFSGVTGQKNTLGELLLVFCAVLIWDYLELRATQPKRRLLQSMSIGWEHLLLLLMGGLLLNQSQSKTAMIALVICIGFSFRRGWLASKIVTAAAYLFILATPFLLFFSNEFGDVIQPIVALVGRDLTFTGRTNIWDKINADTVNPLIGCGYWNFWKGPRGQAISDSIQWQIPTAHCGYLDLYLDGGILALVVFFGFLAAYGWRRIKDNSGSRFEAFRIGLLCSAIVYNLTESSFVRLGLLWFATLMLVVDFPRMKHAVLNHKREPRKTASAVRKRTIGAGERWSPVA